MYKVDLEKGEESEIKLTTFIGSAKKQENSRKTFIYALLYLVQIHSFHSYNIHDCNHFVSEETGVQGGSVTSLSHPVTKTGFSSV